MPSSSTLSPLPPDMPLDTKPIFQALITARSALAELKGKFDSLPNQDILIETLWLQEALASSEIENIVTTLDEAFRVDLYTNTGSVEAKEVVRYRDALRLGYDAWRKHQIISENTLIGMFRLIKEYDGGYRKTPGTVLRNARTGELVYKPPQHEQEIIALMRDLEVFINDHESCSLDPLIKMALIHHQFESIHPFPDGNGRVGRILNVLYLTHTGLLNVPILYLSCAINHTKPEYYRLLRTVRVEGAWEEWIVYMLSAVEKTATSTLQLVTDIHDLMQQTKVRMRGELPKIYSQDLLNSIFSHPYTRIKFLEEDLNKSRGTVNSYLKNLVQHNFLEEVRHGRNNYYINTPLMDLLQNLSGS